MGLFRERPMFTASKTVPIIAALAASGFVWLVASSSNCPGSKISSTWTDCDRSLTFANGDKLSGHFDKGKIAGTATYIFANGDRYTGEFSELRELGGNLRITGNGTYFYSNGSRYVGNMLEGTFNGRGTLYYPNGDKYEGEFREDRLNGLGTIHYANGSSYIGRFREDRPIGGTFTPAPTASKPPTAANAGLTVKLAERGGVFELPIRLNDVITLNAVLDSGSADVSVPEDVYRTLRRTGTISEEDARGEGVYKIADGSAQVQQKFRIRSITIANMTVRNVAASVMADDGNGDILLGQTFLKRFRSAAIDHQKQTLTLSQ